MAFPQVASITETGITPAATNLDFDLPATIDAGDLLLLFVALGSTSISSGPAGWTELWLENGTGTNGAGACYAKDAIGDEGGGTVRVVATANTAAAGQVYRISVASWAGTLADDVDTTGDGTSSSSANPNSPEVIADWGAADNLFISMFSARDDDATVNVYPANYTNGTDTVSGGGGNAGATTGSARRELNASSDNPGAYTLSESERWRSVSVVVKPDGMTYKLEGVTKDINGNTLGICDCHLYKLDGPETDAAWIAFDESDGSGNYSFTGIGDNDAKYFVIAWKDDSPHVFDSTDHVLIPVLE